MTATLLLFMVMGLANFINAILTKSTGWRVAHIVVTIICTVEVVKEIG